MSDETYKALDTAIRAHVSDQYDGPTLVTDFVVLVAAESLDATITRYHYTTREGMPAHVMTGLIRHFQVTFDRGEMSGDDE